MCSGTEEKSVEGDRVGVEVKSGGRVENLEKVEMMIERVKNSVLEERRVVVIIRMH